MDQQITMNDIIPNETKLAVRQFNEASYAKQNAGQQLSLCRNRHEGYGLLADNYVSVCGAVDGVKAAMKDCLKTLGGEDADFQESSDALYAALTELSISVTAMSVQALNVIQRLMERQADAPLPLLADLEDPPKAESDEESEDDSDDTAEAAPDEETPGPDGYFRAVD